jgi:biopolymer transport protein ExbB/biopolymer transport protein TolQ
MEINLLEMWENMGLAVRGVVLALTAQAIACIAVSIDRLLLLIRSRKASTKFVREVGHGGEDLDAAGLLTLAQKFPASHLAGYLEKGLKSFVALRDKGHAPAEAAELTRRALERKAEPLSRDLNRFMNVLASTGSTAPFVGLLGTVLGIIHAFKMIAATGSGGIGTIGAAIGEALIVTGYGLIVAIPTVLLFNWMSGRLAAYEGDILNAAGDVLDRLETQDLDSAVGSESSSNAGRGASGSTPSRSKRRADAATAGAAS